MERYPLWWVGGATAAAAAAGLLVWRVQEWYRSGLAELTLGRDVRTQAAIAEKVNDLIKRVHPGQAATFTDPLQAGEHLGALLGARPRRLLVLDDVWYPTQLSAFPVGRRCARLVTTRNPSLLVSGGVDGVPVKVDQMSVTQARMLLTWGLQPLPPMVVAELLAETGRWPLLLRLVNKFLTDQARTNSDLAGVACHVRDRLRSGPQEIDELTGATRRGLNVEDPEQRRQAVRTTIEASTGLLSDDEQTRFTELAIFAADERVPVDLVAQLSQATGGLNRLAVGALCVRLDDLALLTLTSTGNGPVIGLHDVVRDFLRDELGRQRLVTLHQVLLNTVAAALPAAAPLDPAQAATSVTAWWELDEHARYLWEHLIEHLLAAERDADADAAAGDLRWVTARLLRFGPAAPFADLALAGTLRANQLRATFATAAHLLVPSDPARFQIDVLHSRLAHDPGWAPQIAASAGQCTWPRLVSRGSPPDLPDPNVRRVLVGHDERGVRLAIARDGTWLATGDHKGTVRIWDAATGEARAIIYVRKRRRIDINQPYGERPPYTPLRARGGDLAGRYLAGQRGPGR